MQQVKRLVRIITVRIFQNWLKNFNFSGGWIHPVELSEYATIYIRETTFLASSIFSSFHRSSLYPKGVFGKRKDLLFPEIILPFRSGKTKISADCFPWNSVTLRAYFICMYTVWHKNINIHKDTQACMHESMHACLCVHVHAQTHTNTCIWSIFIFSKPSLKI